MPTTRPTKPHAARGVQAQSGGARTSGTWRALSINYTVALRQLRVLDRLLRSQIPWRLEDDTDVTQFFLSTATTTAAADSEARSRAKQDLRSLRAGKCAFSSTFQGTGAAAGRWLLLRQARAPRDYEVGPPPGGVPGFRVDRSAAQFSSIRATPRSTRCSVMCPTRWCRSSRATVGMRWFRDTATFHQVTDGFFSSAARQSIYDAPTSSEKRASRPKYLLEYKVPPGCPALRRGGPKGFSARGWQTTSHCLQARPPAGCDADLANLGVTAGRHRRLQVRQSLELRGWNSSRASRTGRFTLNGAAFSIDWDKIQAGRAPGRCAGTVTRATRGSRAPSTGPSSSNFNGRLLPELTFGLGVGYEDAHITEQGSRHSASGAGSPVLSGFRTSPSRAISSMSGRSPQAGPAFARAWNYAPRRLELLGEQRRAGPALPRRIQTSRICGSAGRKRALRRVALFRQESHQRAREPR